MAYKESHSHDGSPFGANGPIPRDEVQYLLTAEPQLLQSISGRAPISQVLQHICEALDTQLGNMFSVISLPSEDPLTIAAIARSATLFRLHKFLSATVVNDLGRHLACLEMYSTLARRPYLGEIQIIERATCLAAIAIERHQDALLSPSTVSLDVSSPDDSNRAAPHSAACH